MADGAFVGVEGAVGEGKLVAVEVGGICVAVAVCGDLVGERVAIWSVDPVSTDSEQLVPKVNTRNMIIVIKKDLDLTIPSLQIKPESRLSVGTTSGSFFAAVCHIFFLSLPIALAQPAERLDCQKIVLPPSDIEAAAGTEVPRVL